jgi:hypothetical protein
VRHKAVTGFYRCNASVSRRGNYCHGKAGNLSRVFSGCRPDQQIASHRLHTVAMASAALVNKHTSPSGTVCNRGIRGQRVMSFAKNRRCRSQVRVARCFPGAFPSSRGALTRRRLAAELCSPSRLTLLGVIARFSPIRGARTPPPGRQYTAASQGHYRGSPTTNRCGRFSLRHRCGAGV